MPTDRVIIEELLLQFPGLTPTEATAISREVAEAIGRGLRDVTPTRSLGALEITITTRRNAGRHEMVDDVARAVLGAVLK